MDGILISVRLLGLASILVYSGFSFSNTSNDDIAIELINPISSLGSVYTGVDYRTYQGSLEGADDRSKTLWETTPSIPFALENGKTVVLRFTFPISFGTPTYFTDYVDYSDWLIRRIPDEIPEDGVFDKGHDYLDDINFDVAYGGVSDTGVISMIGIAGLLPWSEDGSIERGQYLLGPEVALGKITSWGIYGARLTHLTNVANESGKNLPYDTNETTLKFFYAYGLGNGWHITSNPVIHYDWEGASNNKLALPIGGGISKTLNIGSVPLKMDFEVYHYIESPDAFGPDWQLVFSLTPVWGQ